MIVLKILGGIILSLLALIFLILCIRVRIFAEYSEIDTHVRLQWLFIKIPLYPVKKKAAEDVNQADAPKEAAVPEEVTSATEEAAPGQAELTDDQTAEAPADETSNVPAPKPKNSFLKTLYNAHGIDGLLLIVKRLFGYLGSYIGDLMKALVIEELYVDVKCTKNDAASTAIYYGEVCSSLFPMLGALISKMKVRKYDINVYPDYLARHSSASFAVAFHLYPIYLIAITLLFGMRLIFKVLFRLLVKCFLPSKSNKAENSDNSVSTGAEKKI